jgi:hypothetical protein
MNGVGDPTGNAQPPARERHSALVAELDRQAPGLEIEPAQSDAKSSHNVATLRRSRRRSIEAGDAVFTLTEVDGVLIWQEGATPHRSLYGRRALRRGFVSPAGEVVTHYRTEKLGLNQVTGMLQKLDDRMGRENENAQPGWGLLKLTRGKTWTPAQNVAGQKPVLVLIHGTFSNAYNVLAEIRAAVDAQRNPVGEKFLDDALKHYGEILAINHKTVAVSPILNAMDLAGYFGGVDAGIDVVAHSRGGLVARWWLDGLDGTASTMRRAVLVGSPLQGTSLAAPDKLRGAMSLLTNYGNALKAAGFAASVYLPFLSVPLAILRLLTSVTSLAAKTPLIDAAIALVPGLLAQSKVLNNEESERLARAKPKASTEYSVIKSNYEPSDPGWKFWKYFRKGDLANMGADLVFDGHNDLVVDTDSMGILPGAPLPVTSIRDFETSSEVHHCNYFRQEKTLNFIRKQFKIP